jgi:hypothetical protein
MGMGRDASGGIFGWTAPIVGASSGSGRGAKQRCDRGQVIPASFCIWLGVLLAIGVSSARAGAVPEARSQIASSEGSMRETVQLQGNAIPEGRLASDEQPAPAPGPGPISPGPGPRTPPEALPPPEKGTEVPIGRLEGYEEEKRKAGEIPLRGPPPGAVQEDPAVRRGPSEPSSCREK